MRLNRRPGKNKWRRSLSRKHPDWSRPLPQPLQILDENYKPMLTLKTLGDVRKMLLGLPEPFQLKTTWGHVAVMLDEAARGGDIMDVVVPLRMVLGMEGISCTAEIAVFDVGYFPPNTPPPNDGTKKIKSVMTLQDSIRRRFDDRT